MDAERTLSSHNITFLEALYESYEQDPNSVDPHWRALIEYERVNTATPTARVIALPELQGDTAPRWVTPDVEQIILQKEVDRLIEHYRLVGHLRADIDPLQRPRGASTESLDLSYYRLSDEHLDRLFYPGALYAGRNQVSLREILGKLQRTYTRRVGVEYWQIQDIAMRTWLREEMEAVENEVVPPTEIQWELLRSLTRADLVDRFLHQKFLGAKRFSVSGAEGVIALLETLIEEAGALGVTDCLFGMAHRGRLSVMMNVMGQTPAQIFSRFEHGDPWENLGSGDVKYHLGCYRNYKTRDERDMYLALMFNPSHLEAITPVVAGRVRASQDRLPYGETHKILGVTLHGDAAIAGQGVFAETLNLSRLPGYGNDGTIRVVINNQVGFTTNPAEGRSTIYPTAVADMLNAPVFHVNGDDPEAAAYVAKLAVKFRQRFKQDVIIDLVCYRRFGHNEGDEPSFTQPDMYENIKNHASVRELYERRLLERGTVTHKDLDQLHEEMRTEFDEALDEVRSKGTGNGKAPMHGVWEHYSGGPDAEVPQADTRISAEVVDQIRQAVTTVPQGFSLHPKLKRLLKDTDAMLRDEAPVSWATGEYLAYGSLLLEGHGIRISGQDSIRGTFTHRHAGWVDNKTSERYFPLGQLARGEAKFQIYNSPLSEFAVVGFEFGYSLATPDKLVIWEAQFGDFVNGAQVIIDQFLSSSEDKWNRISGLVLFLPHGYEGQGPEHSSARLERFLQLCAEDNMQVCNLTCPSQVFHALRRQIHRQWRKPLVIMTPKSLLRTRASFSPLSEFTNGSFRRLIDDEQADPAKIRRVIACSGKVYYDLIEARESRNVDDVAILRIEQLHPFPSQQLADALARYNGATELIWAQEEPKNMGSWVFVRPLLEAVWTRSTPPRYAGRDASASPATGSLESHKLEQDMIMQDAFDKSPNT